MSALSLTIGATGSGQRVAGGGWRVAGGEQCPCCLVESMPIGMANGTALLAIQYFTVRLRLNDF
jgi:hypothetical protein